MNGSRPVPSPSGETADPPAAVPPHDPESRLAPIAWRALLPIFLAQAVVLTALSGRYGFHRDELYFLAAGKRLAWSYPDQPPLAPLLARASAAVFGETPTGLRVVATVAALLTVLVVALLAREFGAGRGAQMFAAASAALSTAVLVVAHMVSTTTFDTLLWTVVVLFAVKLLRTRDTRWWLVVGAATGVALTGKWLVLALLGSLAVALLITGPRRILAGGYLPAGIAIALVLVAPVVVWQARHGFPMVSLAGEISHDDGGENRALFVPMQLVYLSPVLVPTLVAGFRALWRSKDLRAVGLSYPVLCVLLLAFGGKPYYAVPLLLVFLAAGAGPTVRWLVHPGKTRRAWFALAAVVGTAISVVVALPVLPAAALGPVLALNKEQGEQVGWPAFVTTISDAWHGIPPDQRASAVIFTRNYGEAGAIELYGPAQDLPQPYSGHASYGEWGPPPDGRAGPVLLVGRGGDSFTACRVVATVHNPIDNDEDGVPISLCEGLKAPWSVLWPGLRRYY